MALLCLVPSPVLPLRCGHKTHHRTHYTESVLVGRSRSLLCPRLWDCPLVVWPARFMDRVVGNRVDSGRMARAISRPRVQTEAGQSGTFMNKRLLLTLLCLAFAIRTPGQAQVQKVPVAVTWDYRAETKTLLVHATNNSGKDIVAYYISIRHKLPDGTWDKQSLSGRTLDSISTLVGIQMSKGTAAYERRLQESGLFTAGTTQDIICYNVNGSDMEVTAEVVFYADGSFDKQDE